MAYELIFTDLGGVVVSVDAGSVVYRLAIALRKRPDEVQRSIYADRSLLEFELGKITPKRYFEGIKRRLGVAWSYEQFVQAWNGMLSPKPEMTALLERLQKNYRVFALSNTNALHLEHMKTLHPALASLEGWVASCEVGFMKPDPRIYKAALKRAGVQPQQAVYFDDRPELAEAAREVGIRAIHFQDPEQLTQELRALGINGL